LPEDIVNAHSLTHTHTVLVWLDMRVPVDW